MDNTNGQERSLNYYAINEELRLHMSLSNLISYLNEQIYKSAFQ